MTELGVMGHNSTNDPCSHWFPGHRAFESPEVNNIANFVTTLPNVVGFLDLRSYGQMSESDSLFSVSSDFVCVSSLFTIFVFLQEVPKGCRKPY